MFKNKLANNVTDTTERAQKNVHNLPLTSVALAGVLGAGVIALLSLGLHARNHTSTSTQFK